MEIICKKYFERDKEYIKNLEKNLPLNLKKIFIETAFFSFFPENITEYYNERTSFFIAYFIKNYIKDKHFCHIGGASGDLELLLSKYAKKITIVETDSNRIQNAILKNKKNQYSCPVSIINKNFFDVNIQADIYFLWIGSKHDYSIIKHIQNNYNKCKIISPNIPYYFYLNKDLNNLIPNNFLVPFDEYLDISYYSANMMKDNDNNIIIIIDNNVYVYKNLENNITYKSNVNLNDFDFKNFKKYNYPFLLKKNFKNNNTPASTFKNFSETMQISLRGYIPIGIIDMINGEHK